MSTAAEPHQPSGIPALGDLPWGEHVCHFYRTSRDLVEMLVPYFAAGLRNHERCIWIASEPLRASEAREVLRAAVPDLDAREARGDIEFFDHEAWYARSGSFEPDAVIAGWLERADAAVRAGYAGLRLTGNTFWLEPHDFGDFAAYEARVHAAFRGRRIIALCSYSLERCGRDEVLDVVRNHELALIRSGGRWQALRSATAALAFLAGEPRPELQGHTVELLRCAGFPAPRIAAALRDGFAAGEAVWALARPAHLAALRAELEAAGIDIAAALAREQLVLADAFEIYARCKHDPAGQIGPLLDEQLERAVARFGRVRLYGETVDLFAAEGDHAGALALEAWWNERLRRLPIEAHCAYCVESFDGAVDALRAVCDEHDAVIPPAGPARDPVQLQAEIELLSRALANEVTRRRELEPAREHLIALQRVMAQVSAVKTIEDLTAIVTRDVCRTVGASRAVLLVEVGGAWRDLVSGGEAPFAPDLHRSVFLGSPAAIRAQAPELAALATEAVAVVPLVAAEPIGALGLGFAAAQGFDTAWRALADDVARSIAHALDRTRAHEAAQRAARAKDEFLAMLGHELRNPLSPILTAVQLLRLRGDERIARERTIIERQAQNLVRLLDDLLDVSRIARGKIELHRRRIDLATAIGQAVEQASAAIEEREHRLIVEIPPAIELDGDLERIAQVFANLLGNAAKYTPHGGRIEVRAALRGDRVAIEVRDDGQGIAPELLPDVFDVFVQGPQTRDRACGGLGLGLAIARRIVELHGGRIAAASDGRGCGSAFTVELPVAAPASSGATAPRHRARTAAHVRRLLVVDDNEDAACLLAMLLEELGHDVKTASDPRAALAIARTYRPEIAVLDIGLPDMDGYALAAALRAQQGDAPPRVIALSGYGQPSDLTRSAEAGFSGHLVKPVDVGQLLDLIARA